jgi:hypothetical protein
MLFLMYKIKKRFKKTTLKTVLRQSCAHLQNLWICDIEMSPRTFGFATAEEAQEFADLRTLN